MNIDIKLIRKKISDIPLKKMRLIKAKCRPPEKSNEILEVIMDGGKWYCERPGYFWSKLGESLVVKGWLEEPKLILDDKDGTGFFDKRGLWWTSYKLSSFYLVPYYLENPSKYVWAMSEHLIDVQKVIATLKQVHRDLDKQKKFALNIERMAQAYYFHYRFPSTIYMIFDELVYQFKLFLLKYFDKKTANIYLSRFLRAEITKEMLEGGYGEKLVFDPESRDVLYASGTEPVIYYRRPKFFHEYPEDMDIVQSLIEKGISKKEYLKFSAFRWIIPIAAQVNEEAQYVESQMLSAHISYLVKKIAKKVNKSVKDLEKLSYRQIIKLL